MDEDLDLVETSMRYGHAQSHVLPQLEERDDSGHCPSEKILAQNLTGLTTP